METALLETLARLLRRYDLAEIELRVGETRLRVVGGAADTDVSRPTPDAPVPVRSKTPDSSASPSSIEVAAAMTGILYLAPSEGAADYVTVGGTVEAGQTIAMLEAMKMMVPIEAMSAGTISAIHKDNGASVQRGDVLFTLNPGVG